MANNRKIDVRPRYIQELRNCTFFHGYKVTESGVVFNAKGKQIKPKFALDGKRIDYVFIDVVLNGVRKRISYHRFIYMAWHPEFAKEDDQSLVVTTIGRRFDYRLGNLKVVTRKEHLAELSKHRSPLEEDERREVVKTFAEIKDYMTKKDFAKRLGISTKTLNKYIKEYET